MAAGRQAIATPFPSARDRLEAQGSPRPAPRSNRTALIVMWLIIAVNFALLAASIGDYRVTVDSGYHVSLARWYAQHGTAWWDHINFGPRGRPNLQGPALHFAIGILGLALGGRARDFILSNAILAVLQWLAAVLTVAYFARKLAGDRAAMLAVALFAGAGFADASFYVGIPSGIVFIAVPWAVWMFVDDRLALSTLITSGSIYAHLGGFVTAPAGLLTAAALRRRWRALALVGIATAILTLPYSIHFLVNIGWYRGRHGHEILHLDPLVDLLALAGLIWILRRPRANAFLLAWFAGSVPWLLQDPYRFTMQSMLAGSVIAGLFVDAQLERLNEPRRRNALAAGCVLLATFFPLGIPSLAGEISWDAGFRFPRLLDWGQARTLAGVITANHLQGRLISDYEVPAAPALAVFAPVSVEEGHWVEVWPRVDPADDMSAGAKAYVMPLAPEDPALERASRLGLVHVWGGDSNSAVVTLTHPGALDSTARLCARLTGTNAAWLAENAVNNDVPSLTGFVALFSASGRAARTRRMDIQRFHAGRIELGWLLYAYALEKSLPAGARNAREWARGFGAVASFLSDGDLTGSISARRQAQMMRHMAVLALAAKSLDTTPDLAPSLAAAVRGLLAGYLYYPWNRFAGV